jgi:hypothetical protein
MPSEPTALPDNQAIPPDPAQAAQAGGGEGEPVVSTAPDKGKTMEQLQAELQLKTQSYDELRSMNDRRFNELQSELKALREAAQAPAKPAVDENWEAEWEEKINQDPGKNVKAFVRGVASDMMAEVDRRVQDRLRDIDGKLLEVNPEFRARKADIERIQKDYGISREAATKIVLNELKPSGPSTPPANQPPGRMTGERGRPANAAPHVETVVFGDNEQALLRYLGIDQKQMAETLGREAARG